jgi:enoyl-CoA hydratase
MGALVSYQLRDSVATITMDGGKVNVLSQAMLAGLGAALGRAAIAHPAGSRLRTRVS